MHTRVPATVPVWGSEDKLRGSILSFHNVAPGIEVTLPGMAQVTLPAHLPERHLILSHTLNYAISKYLYHDDQVIVVFLGSTLM